MLKLKHLFANSNAALMVFNYWFDLKEVPESFNYFRTSSNAVYPVEIEESIYYLRMAPKEEKNKEYILAELEFLTYLNEHHHTVVESVPSKEGNHLEEVSTPFGEYYAVVFKRVKGKQLGQVSITNEVLFNWGQSLGRLHALSKTYKSTHKRPSYKDQFAWMKKVLQGFQGEDLALKELNLLQEAFTKLHVTEDNYGLIHFDYEPDNVFYEESNKTFTPIDFDDSVYHWYVCDLERSLNSIRDEFPEECYELYTEEFLNGYRSIKEIDEELFAYLPLFRRYASLYGYIRCLRSLEETWKHEPEWMTSLRGHLERLMNKRSHEFGNSVQNM